MCVFFPKDWGLKQDFLIITYLHSSLFLFLRTQETSVRHFSLCLYPSQMWKCSCLPLLKKYLALLQAGAARENEQGSLEPSVLHATCFLWPLIPVPHSPSSISIHTTMIWVYGVLLVLSNAIIDVCSSLLWGPKRAFFLLKTPAMAKMALISECALQAALLDSPAPSHLIQRPELLRKQEEQLAFVCIHSAYRQTSVKLGNPLFPNHDLCFPTSTLDYVAWLPMTPRPCF